MPYEYVLVCFSWLIPAVVTSTLSRLTRSLALHYGIGLSVSVAYELVDSNFNDSNVSSNT